MAIDSMAALERPTVISSVIVAPGGTGIDVRTANALVWQSTVDSVDVGARSVAASTVRTTIVGTHTTAGFTGAQAEYCLADAPSAFGPGDEAKGAYCVEDNPFFCGPGEYTLRVESYGSLWNNPQNYQIGARETACLADTLAHSTNYQSGTLGMAGDVVIPSGTSLYLGADATIRVSAGDSEAGGMDPTRAELIVEGVLDAGYPDLNAHVVFESAEDDPGPGDWQGIVVKAGGNLSLLNDTVRHAKEGIRFEAGAQGGVHGVHLERNQVADIKGLGVTGATEVLLEDNVIDASGAYGVYLYGNNSGVTLDGNVITNADTLLTTGIRTGGSASSNPAITGNAVSGFAKGEGIRIDTGGPTVVKNEVAGCKYGVYVAAGSARIGDAADSQSDNLIHNNTEGLRSLCASATPLVRNNQFTANGTAVRVLKGQAPVANLGTLGGDDGLNSFVSNTACVVNNTTATVWAVGNWWGDCAAPSCNQGTVIVNDWKCMQPAGARRPGIERVEPRAQKMRLLGAWPNPTRGDVRFGLALEDGYGEVDVSVFDVAGRLVRALEGARLHAGEHHLTWDGRDHTGRRVPTGMYFARIRANDRGLGVLRVLVVR